MYNSIEGGQPRRTAHIRVQMLDRGAFISVLDWIMVNVFINHVNEFVSRYDRYDRHDSCSKSNTHCAKVSPGVVII